MLGHIDRKVCVTMRLRGRGIRRTPPADQMAAVAKRIYAALVAMDCFIALPHSDL
jgi:hypothetical protein